MLSQAVWVGSHLFAEVRPSLWEGLVFATEGPKAAARDNFLLVNREGPWSCRTLGHHPIVK